MNLPVPQSTISYPSQVH